MHTSFGDRTNTTPLNGFHVVLFASLSPYLCSHFESQTKSQWFLVVGRSDMFFIIAQVIPVVSHLIKRRRGATLSVIVKSIINTYLACAKEGTLAVKIWRAFLS